MSGPLRSVRVAKPPSASVHTAAGSFSRPQVFPSSCSLSLATWALESARSGKPGEAAGGGVRASIHSPQPHPRAVGPSSGGRVPPCRGRPGPFPSGHSILTPEREAADRPTWPPSPALHLSAFAFGHQSTRVQKSQTLRSLHLCGLNLLPPHASPGARLGNTVSWRRTKDISIYYFQNIIPLTNTRMCSHHMKSK